MQSREVNFRLLRESIALTQPTADHGEFQAGTSQ